MENVFVERFGDMTQQEAEFLMGKTVSAVDSREFRVMLTFTDGTTVTFSGCADSSVMVDLSKAE
jgi:hypothetical protein